jgi:DNA-binding Lrp family transcriptional regulator
LSNIDLRIDKVDLQILKILTLNCRTSYRSIGKTLGISMNTVRTRINNLIHNKAIEKFITIVNFSLFGYSGDVLTILLKASKKLGHVIDNVANRMKDWGPIYMHIEIFDGVHVIGIAVKNAPANGYNFDSLKGKLSKELEKSISILDVFLGKHTALVSEEFHLRKVDLEIIECLLSDPRMTFLNIARTLGYSQKTIIRRIERLKSSHAIMGFSLQYNPSKMKGYNYFSLLIRTRLNMATEVMKEISYSELYEYILRFPLFTYSERVIIVFHIEDVLDIDSIVNKIRSIKGVVKAEAYQPIRIRWHEEWLKKEIRNYN